MASTVVPFHSCFVIGKWGWASDERTGRWTNPQQCYKKQRVHIPTNPSAPQDTGFDVKHSKLKLRGSGKAVTIRFDSEEGKDFQILGYEIPFTMDGTP